MNKADRCIIAVPYHHQGAQHHSDMRLWLYENIDPDCYDAEDWTVLDSGRPSRNIWFAREQDAVWFALRWS